MTNKELRDLKRRIKENKYLTKTEVDYIIKALEKEPCEDAISRESVLRLFATHDGKYLYEAIQELPSVLPEQ